jgi:nondiscriminating aspartyl-tRNA synthetase
MTVLMEGLLHEGRKSSAGLELRLKRYGIILTVKGNMMPVPVSKWKMKTSLETKLLFRLFLCENPGEGNL